MNILLGLLTIVLLLGLGVLLSEDRKAIKFKPVLICLGLQALVIYFVLKNPVGQAVLEFCTKAVSKGLSFGNSGLEFVFGGFSTDFYSFAINVLALICFTSAVISVLYYLRVIPFLVKYIGGFISKLLGTSAPETFNAVGNSFLGGTEAPLLIKPFLKDLTRSELFAVVVGGFSSASAGVMGGYALMGIPMKYMLIGMATVPLSTLLIAKIIIPETKESKFTTVEITKSEDSNVFEAIGTGGLQGMNVALAVGATLIAFLGLTALLDYLLGFIGTNTTQLLGYLFTPLAWLFNIPSAEVTTFSSLIGIKTSLNEFVAYTDMGALIHTLSPRTIAILSVALCNFANFSFIGITVGGFKAICPERAEEVAGMGIKALLGGLITTLVTASLIGLFF